MKKTLTLGALLGLAMSQAGGRIWTDTKGRKIEAEFVSQSKDAVVLRLKDEREVTVPFTNLSREDLAYLIDLEMKEAKEGGKPQSPEATENPSIDGSKKPVPDPAWDRPVLKKLSLTEPLKIEEEKREDGVIYSSPHFRIVADDRITDKAVMAMLEACELTKMYCESLPFGLAFRSAPIEGKYEIRTYGKEKDWTQAGENPAVPCQMDPVTGKIKICLEALGLGSTGRGSSEGHRRLAGQMILNISRSMIPELYRQTFKDWFNEGFPNVLNRAVYEKGSLDFTEIVPQTRDFLLGKGGAGQGAIFKKEITMMTMDDLVGQTMAGPADEDERRRFLGQCMLLVTYFMFLEDDGKATGMRNGFRFLTDFEKNFPKTIRYSTPEELEEKKAELAERRKAMVPDTMKELFRDRPMNEVEKDMAARWEAHGLKLVFGQDGEDQ